MTGGVSLALWNETKTAATTIRFVGLLLQLITVIDRQFDPRSQSNLIFRSKWMDNLIFEIPHTHHKIIVRNSMLSLIICINNVSLIIFLHLDKLDSCLLVRMLYINNISLVLRVSWPRAWPYMEGNFVWACVCDWRLTLGEYFCLEICSAYLTAHQI